jgi:hypothetical protein
MEIAKGVKAEDYIKLDLSDYKNSDWQIAVDYFDKRITDRFLEPIKVLQDFENEKLAIDKKFGFTILAIDFLLVETLQSFIEGKTNTDQKSRKIFKRFLRERDSFKPYFIKDFDPEDFYINFRCGILHQAQTFGNTKVWAVGELIRKVGEYTIVNRELFHTFLLNEYENYKRNLLKQIDVKLMGKFKLKMDFISGNNK